MPGILRRFRLPLLGVLIVFAYGVLGYMLFGFVFVDALYMTALALTTAGFNPVADLTSAEKSFTVSIAVLGVTLFLVLLAMITTAVAEGRLLAQRRIRKMERRIEGFEDHYIVCAYGRVGRAAAREFEAEGVRFVVMDAKEELEDEMQRDGVYYLIGNPAAEGMLRRAGLEKARGLVCAMDDDSDNVYVTIVARSLNPDIFIVARASAPGSPEVLYKAGADRVISPYVTSGRHMGRLTLRPRVRDYIDLDDEQKHRLEEILVDAVSPLVGRSVGEACGEAVPLLLWRAQKAPLPNPPPRTMLEPGDVLLVFGESEQLRPVEGD